MPDSENNRSFFSTEAERRQKCIQTLANAPTETLVWLAHLLERSLNFGLASEEQTPKKLVQISAIQWYSDGTVLVQNKDASNDHLPIFPMSTLPGLFAYVWMHRIGQMMKPIEANESINWPFGDVSLEETLSYKDHPEKSKFEILCLNGCGLERKGRSEHCSPSCQKDFHEWCKGVAATADDGARSRKVQTKQNKIALILSST